MREITVVCKLCGTILAGQDQFIGHMIHSHEAGLESALNAWNMMKTISIQPELIGEMANR